MPISTEVSVDGTPVSTLSIDSTPLAVTGVAGKAVRAYALNTSQTFASSAITAVHLNTLDFNDDTNLYGVNLTTGVATIKASGLYLVNYAVKYSGGAAGERSAVLRWNGSSYVRESQGWETTTNTSSRGGTAILRLSANDTLELTIWVSGGTAVNIVDSNSSFTSMTVACIGS